MSELPDVSVAALRRLARGILFDRHGAEDVLQEAWLTELRASPPAASRAGWLTVVVRNLALNRRREEARRDRRERAVARPEAHGDPSEALAHIEVLRRLLAAVEQLDEPYRSAVVLRYLEEQPPRRIARRLGLPVNTVRTHVRRGLERLRRDLDGERGEGRQELLAALAAFAGEPRTPLVPWSRARWSAQLLIVAGPLLAVGAWVVLRGSSLPPSSVPSSWSREPSVTELAPTRSLSPAAGREPVERDSQPVHQEWVVRGHANHGDHEPFPDLPLLGRVHAGTAPTGTPWMEARFSTDELGDFAWTIVAPEELVTLTIEPEIAGHTTVGYESLLAPGDAAPQRCVVSASPFDMTIAGCVRHPDGRPIAGAIVVGFPELAARTDADGRFQARASSRAFPADRCGLQVRAPGFASAQVSAEIRPGEVWVPDVVLRPEVRLRGRVTDEHGRAVANAEVCADDAESTSSDEHGLFELGGLADDGQTLTLVVTKAGHAGWVEEIERERWASEIAVQLGPGVRVSGKILDGERQPIWGARIELEERLFALTTSTAPPMTISGRDGVFAMEHVPAGSHRLWIAKGEVLEHLDLVVSGDTDEVELEPLVIGERFLEGVVQDEAGRPVPWAAIQAIGRRRFFGHSHSHSGRDGRFRLSGLPRDGVRLYVFSRGLMRLEREVTQLDRSDLVLRFEPGSSLAGTVVEAGTNAPLASFSVRSRLHRDELAAGSGPRMTFDPRVHFAASTDGMWTIATASPPGTDFELEVSAAGYVTAKVERASTTGSPSCADLVIRLARGTRIRGLVLAAENGEPLEGVRVLRLEPWQQLEHAGERPAAFEATTDAAGRFELHDVPTGEMVLALESPGRAPWLDRVLHVSSVPVERVIEIPVGATVRGRLLDPAGRPLPGEALTLEAWEGVQRYREWHATTDADGAFVLGPLARGTYGLEWEAQDEGSWSFSLREAIDVQGDEAREIELQPRGRAVLVGSVAYDGTLPEDVSIWVRPVVPDPVPPERERWARTSWDVRVRDGRFEVAHLEPGEYEVFIEFEVGEPDPQDPFLELDTAYGAARVQVPEEGSVAVRLPVELLRF